MRKIYQKYEEAYSLYVIDHLSNDYISSTDVTRKIDDSALEYYSHFV